MNNLPPWAHPNTDPNLVSAAFRLQERSVLTGCLTHQPTLIIRASEAFRLATAPGTDFFERAVLSLVLVRELFRRGLDGVVHDVDECLYRAFIRGGTGCEGCPPLPGPDRTQEILRTMTQLEANRRL